MNIKFRFGVLLLIISTFAASSKPALQSTEILNLVNQDRISHGLKELSLSSSLSLAAQAKALDMIRKNYFGHEDPLGTKPWFWFKHVGYNYVYAGENLAQGFSDAQDLETSWMSSPAHRANILSPFYSDLGLAVVSVGDRNIVVEFFGTPDHKYTVNSN